MKKSEYMVVWNTEDCIDGIPEDSFEQAKTTALNILEEWAEDGFAIIKKESYSKEVIDGWNEMIETCWVSVHKYNHETKEYEEFCSPSDDDFERIGAFGWFPLTNLKGLFEEAQKIKEFSDFEVAD